MIAAAAASSTDVGSHLFWLASRAAGVVAVAMLSFTVIVGLMQGGRIPLGFKARDLNRIHEFCSLAAIIAIITHGVLLLADPWLQPTLSQILFPFKLDYRSFYTGLGIVGAWIAVILGLSYYVRQHIGIKRWKTIHRFTIVAYALSVVHVLGAGTDAQETWLKAPLLTSAAVVVVLLVARFSRPSPGAAATRPSSSHRPTTRARQTQARPLHR